ncbi:AmmeMemoRadiSam system protein B [Aliifodinibius salicampi]|uniref:AmmeMemoRadiSam system protein B n=1 Tax=Fodinibius salicampi TaxID=1920655 RepID=A0ABT3PW98_9BACT|nr:AmmeMemoRadiSam system protein B [Fodinibius salicampi]MCW9712134.1 AmmeMemoRadiSam system protein B [Fodinibius salicampi]
MNITSYSRQQIEEGINTARKNYGEPSDDVRILFTPQVINEDNFKRVCDIYSRVDFSAFDTVVVIESHDQSLDKKLPMASNDYFETPLGKVPVNDYMRNEFCDEDDDFYIHDEAFDKDISLFQQLMFIQTQTEDISAVSVQIADTNPAIVKEVAYVLEEVLASRNALLVFCCELENIHKKEFRKVAEMVSQNNHSGLLNYLNSGESKIKGTTSFIAGIIVANKWGADLTFLENIYENYEGSLLTAYADRQQVFFS